ncbi:uncharacterized protein LOC108670340 [Hyalella azteca]|uniref:Uncharacterized protein LOC108670340 n=1 Tax=Hyalella azteca TaxID=294128 RepID=A0A8B7NI35_HYAAZ|nr:uncharacterized protein LOC108670340 [Hyalella azteca]
MGSTDKSAKLTTDAEDEDTKNFKTSKHEEDVPQTEPVKPKTSSCSTIPGSAAGSNPGRLRHDSNSSCDSARSPSSDRMKRRRTTSLSSSPLSSFFFPPPSQGISNSPSSPSFSTLLSSSPSSTFVSSSSSGGSGSPPLMSLDEVMSAVNGVTNMALAHEIALDHNFKLEKFEPPQASLEKQVRDMVHQAFWDNLKEQLSHTPPVYTQAFVLLQEVRDQLLELTLPHQLRLRQQISDKLDLELIQQQARHHVLDFCECVVLRVLRVVLRVLRVVLRVLRVVLVLDFCEVVLRVLRVVLVVLRVVLRVLRAVLVVLRVVLMVLRVVLRVLRAVLVVLRVVLVVLRVVLRVLRAVLVVLRVVLMVLRVVLRVLRAVLVVLRVVLVVLRVVLRAVLVVLIVLRVVLRVLMVLRVVPMVLRLVLRVVLRLVLVLDSCEVLRVLRVVLMVLRVVHRVLRVVLMVLSVVLMVLIVIRVVLRVLMVLRVVLRVLMVLRVVLRVLLVLRVVLMVLRVVLMVLRVVLMVLRVVLMVLRAVFMVLRYTIQMIRPTIVKHIVEYERKKFKEFLATQQDGLELTRAWVLKHVDNLLRQNKESGDTRQPSQAPPLPKNEASDTRQLSQAPPLLEDPLALRAFCNNALNNAYMELLQWPQDELLPETVCVDRERVLELRDRLHQVCLLSAVLLVTLNTATHAHPPLAASHDALRAELKRDLCPILDPAYTQQETLEALPNLTEQVLVTLERFMSRRGGAAPAEVTSPNPPGAPTLSPSPPGAPTLSPSMRASVRCQLGELRAPGHRVTTLLTERCLAFLSLVLSNTSGARNTALPAPFCVLQEEVARICGGFLRFTQHNRAVFGEFYFDMAEQRLKQAFSPRHMSSPSAVSTDPSTNLTSLSTNPTAPSTNPTSPSTNPTAPSTNPTAPSTNPTTPSIDPTALSPDKSVKYAEISPENADESKLKPETSTEKPEKLADVSSNSAEFETKVKNPIQDSGKKSRSEIEDVNVEKIEGGRADKKGEESVTFDGSAGKDTGEDKGSGITEQSSCVSKDNKDKNEENEPAAGSGTGKHDSEARKRWDSLDLD